MAAAFDDWAGHHVGRSWTGTPLEDACPCPKQPCGLVRQGDAHPDCREHPIGRAKSMRQGHPADKCPTTTEETT
jgi:hypothetical protein